ncbi:MAG TPA: addiction module protein [Segetibacter sp.]|jgi:3-dehydroquinate synthase class II
MTPQFTYDNKGNAVGVFLPIEDWNQLKNNLPNDEELPQWQRDILDKRMMLIQQDPGNVVPLENFIAEMEKEANEEV